MTLDLKEPLAAALRADFPDEAELLARPNTTVEEYERQVLPGYRLLRVTHMNPHKPVVFFAGYAEHQPALVLTARPEQFVRMARLDRVTLVDEEGAAAYVRAFVEVTRSQGRLSYVVDSIDELRFRPGLDEQEAALRAEVVERTRELIRPATATRTNGGFEVTLYRVREQALERLTAHVEPSGAIEVEATVLERDLPLVYGR